MIRFKQKGDFSKATHYFKKIGKAAKITDLDKYGKRGVEALASATPRDTGLTAASWQYSITRERGKATLSFHNTNFQNGIPIAIILQYGHATRNGGWVQGIDYINPAIRPIFEELANQAWEEMKY